MRTLQVEQSRRNNMQEIELIIREELDAGRQRIIDRLSDRQTIVDIFGEAALKPAVNEKANHGPAHHRLESRRVRAGARA